MKIYLYRGFHYFSLIFEYNNTVKILYKNESILIDISPFNLKSISCILVSKQNLDLVKKYVYTENSWDDFKKELNERQNTERNNRMYNK